MSGRLQMPAFLRDLFGDLRDRRLLVPVVALLLAIAAAPFLLGGSPEPVPPAPAVASIPPDSAEVEAAVLVEQAGIRNYRERLEALRKKNPFKQQFQIEPPDTSVAVGEDSGGGTLGDASISLAGDDAGASEPVPSSPDLAAATPPADDSDASVSFEDSGDTSEPRTEVREVETVLSYEVDVEVGRVGELEVREAVPIFEQLPSKQAPVLIYVGVSENAKRAAFLVSGDVIGTRGDGICVRSKSGECALLTLAVGERRDFLYGPDSELFRLKLRAISVIEEPASE